MVECFSAAVHMPELRLKGVSMKRLRILAALIAGLACVTSVGQSQDGKASFSIAITAPQVVHSGQPIVVDITIKNLTDHIVAFDGDSPTMAERNFTIELADAQGEAPPETQYLMAVRGEDQGPGHNVIVLTGHLIQRDLKPGETVKQSLDLARLFNLTLGTYKLTVLRQEFEGGRDVFVGMPGNGRASSSGNIPPPASKLKAISRSNTIQFSVVP
jgi:hypothetical protein